MSGRTQCVRLNGKKSSPIPVTSGIPQGTVLGPLLFVCYINDLPSAVLESFIAMFADDTKLSRPVSDRADHVILQRDLDYLYNWSVIWLLGFNKDKCKVLHIRLGPDDEIFEYTMGGTALGATAVEKDLGVLVDGDLSFTKHVETQVAKANSLVGLIRRTFVYLDADIMKRMFIAIVRPQLEYCTVTWTPSAKLDRYKIENVLRRATSVVPELKGLPYEERLARMGIPSMWYRQQRADVIEVWKYLNDEYDCDRPFLPLVEDACEDRPRAVTRAATSKQLEKRRADDCPKRANFFSYRAVNPWNSLSPQTRQAPTLNTFKNRLDAEWKKKINRTPYGPFADWPIIED